MIIWSGLGFLVPLIMFFLPMFVRAGFDTVFGAGSSTSHFVPRMVSGGILCASLFFLGAWLNKDDLEAINSKDGVSDRAFSMFKQRHSFLFIPFQYWGLILVPFLLLVAFL